MINKSNSYVATSTGFEPVTDGLEIREAIERMYGLSAMSKFLTFPYGQYLKDVLPTPPYPQGRE